MAGAKGGSGGGGAGSTGSAGSSEILAATPPMGWNSWNAFDCNISEAKIKAAADALVTSGMKDAGYQYVCVDDCWMNGRDAAGNIQWDTTKFPSGMSALGSYIHGKGLKFGIYSAPNTGTCQGLYGNPSMPSVYVGSLNHEQQDAKSYAAWTQGPHQAAQKSTRVSPLLPSTSAANEVSVTCTTLVLDMRYDPFQSINRRLP